MDIVSAVLAFLKIVGTVLGLVQQNRDQQTGAELQKGSDAQAALAQAQAAIAARDVPALRPDGRLPDGTTDVFNRDNQPGVPGA